MGLANLPLTKIGNLEFYLIQGGMGVGISQAGLASAVANEGGAGIIASVGLGAIKGYFNEELQKNSVQLKESNSSEKKLIFNRLYAQANKLALNEEIQIARKKTNGVIGVNIMHALSDYSSLIEGAIEGKADLIISGAGIPRDLPSYLNGSKTMLVPIVSSARLTDMLCKSWARQGHLPDAIIVEGPKAGGHLGYSYEELKDNDFVENGLARILSEVIKVVKTYEVQSGKNIPVIAAGGIFYGGDIRKAREEWKVDGVQMATRFVTTYECDASEQFKQTYITCNEQDLRIIKSPVGMPGRAITNNFLNKVEQGEKVPIVCPYHCLKTCVPEESPYCIANALSFALKGNFENGYAFAGSNAWRCKEIISVKELFSKLDEEYGQRKVSD